MRTTAPWADLCPPLDLPAAPPPERVDVAVVGGGYTGLSAALALVRQGASVAVLERGAIGAGASAVNGGQLTTGLKMAGPKVFARYGPLLGKELWQASVAAVRDVAALIRDARIDCDYNPSGTLSLAFRPRHYDLLARSAEWLRTHVGHERRLVPKDAMSTEIGSHAFFGGLSDPVGGNLNPAKLLFGLARLAAAERAAICQHTAVHRIHRAPAGRGFTLDVATATTTADAASAAHAEILTDRVLIATNGYTDGLVPGLQARLFPVGSYMIATRPLDAALHRVLSPRGRAFFDTRRFLNYFGLSADGRMTFGGRNNLSTGLDLATSAAHLRRSMVRVFPQLAATEITHSWSGRLGLTFDLLPHIGQIGGIYYALGYSGHGVALASHLGCQAAGLLTGRLPRSPFAEIDHPTRFFYRKNPWFLPFAASYFRLVDWLR